MPRGKDPRCGVVQNRKKTDRHEFSTTERAQALTLWHQGAPFTQITKQVGMQRSAVANLAKRAKARGWVPGEPILIKYVENLPRGRKPVIDEADEEVIRLILARNTSARIRDLSKEVAEVWRGQLGREGDPPSATSIWRKLKERGGYKGSRGKAKAKAKAKPEDPIPEPTLSL